MSLFSDGELRVMRREALETMSERATILRAHVTPDSAGGVTDEWEPAEGLEAVPCRYWQKGTQAREVEGTTRVQVVSLWGFAFPHDTDIRSTDRIGIGPENADGSLPSGSRRWEVVQGGRQTDASELVVTALEVV